MSGDLSIQRKYWKNVLMAAEAHPYPRASLLSIGHGPKGRALDRSPSSFHKLTASIRTGTRWESGLGEQFFGLLDARSPRRTRVFCREKKAILQILATQTEFWKPQHAGIR